VPEMSLLRSVNMISLLLAVSSQASAEGGSAVHRQQSNPNSLIFFSKNDTLALHEAVGRHIILINI